MADVVESQRLNTEDFKLLLVLSGKPEVEIRNETDQRQILAMEDFRKMIEENGLDPDAFK